MPLNINFRVSQVTHQDIIAPEFMNLKNIAGSRQQTQLIGGGPFITAKDIVAWMGAMQAQDYLMAKWAIGTRLPGSTNEMVEAAINKGDILRTHILRPTWHFVTPENISWMQALSAPQIKTLMRSRDKELELTEVIYKKSNGIIQKALSAGEHLTREALMSQLQKAGIATHDYRSGHLMLRAELDGIVCSGAIIANKETYALLATRVPATNSISREEALGKLANIYFTSHGPATLADFTWWAGLPVKDAVRGFEMIKPRLLSEKIDATLYWFTDSFTDLVKASASLFLLPAFDEFLISYKDRSAAIELRHQLKAFSNNGIFRPVIIRNGQVVGLWKRTISKNKLLIEADPFKPFSQAVKNQLNKTAETYGRFLSMQTEVIYSH